MAGLFLAWQDWQSVAPAAAWLKLAGFQPEVLWQAEHWPEKWLAGFLFAWQPWQSVAPAALWLKVAGFQAVLAWQAEHWPS